MVVGRSVSCFFFNDTATTEIYTLSLHDALPISLPTRRVGRAITGCDGRRVAGAPSGRAASIARGARTGGAHGRLVTGGADRKSTRLNSSHANISYAVFCLKKKNISNSGLMLHFR